MTQTTEPAIAASFLGKLIHIGSIFEENGRWRYLFLRKTETGHFKWHRVQDNHEDDAAISAPSAEAAIYLAGRHWKSLLFRPLNCGFKYYLPERDEHGINALFYQMVASCSSMNGIYYDEELGNNCIVHNIPEMSVKLWRRLKEKNRLGA